MKATAEASLLTLEAVLGRCDASKYDECLHNLEEFLGGLPRDTLNVLLDVADELKDRVVFAL